MCDLVCYLCVFWWFWVCSSLSLSLSHVRPHPQQNRKESHIFHMAMTQAFWFVHGARLHTFSKLNFQTLYRSFFTVQTWKIQEVKLSCHLHFPLAIVEVKLCRSFFLATLTDEQTAWSIINLLYIFCFVLYTMYFLIRTFRFPKTRY